ncbi:hypothetical protein [Spiroplasma endosymbiont of Apeira syringaria]|uniref:hypothetical protein n=1 Tax=Spiroplasma endosymbiont of Apeira syringaria TaxID=3066307 RepID=UPI0030D092CF
MQDIAVQFEKHCWIHSVSLFPPQVHVGRSPSEIFQKITAQQDIKDILNKSNSTFKNKKGRKKESGWVTLYWTLIT